MEVVKIISTPARHRHKKGVLLSKYHDLIQSSETSISPVLFAFHTKY